MTLLSADDIREHVDTDKSDAAIQLLLEDAEDEIVQRYGPHAEDGTVTERFLPVSGERVIYPTRRVDADQPIVVTRSTIGSVEVETAGADEYSLDGPLELRLLGYYGWAGNLVQVEYTPLSDTPRRKRVQLDLVRLALRYEALQSSRMGDASVGHVDYEQEREAILKRLGTGLGSFA